jgi:predicted transposase/invertase (TIGR01784 family)
MENADESIKKAKEVLDEISEDEHEQYLAHLREKYIFERQGIEQEKRMLAKKMKEDNVDLEKIIKYTGLTKEEIEKI